MSPSRSIIRGYIIAGLLLALLLSGCASGRSTAAADRQGDVSSVTIAEKIETSGTLDASLLTQLAWGTGGLVDTVNVTVGQTVKKGDVLASLKADSVPASVVSALSDLATAKRDLDELQKSSLSQAEAQQAFLAAKKDVEEATNLMTALDYPRASDALIENAQAKIWEAEKNLTFAARKYKEVQNHPDGDPQKTAAQLALTNAQLTLNELKATYNYYTAKATEADYAEAKANLDVARANLEAARRRRERVKNGVDPLTIAAAEAKVAAAQAAVDAMFAIAPFDGEVIAVQAASGNAVSKDDAAVALVDRSTLRVEAQIDETAISTVALGNLAEATLDSLPTTVLKGKVTQINPIGSAVNGLVKYSVTVSFEPTDQPLLFGATLSVIIYTGEPHSMLAVPVSAVQTDAQGEYVNVVGAGGIVQRVAITSNDLIDALVTITPLEEGKLAEGDKVQLGTSTSSSSSSSSSNRDNQGGGIPIPGAGGPPGG